MPSSLYESLPSESFFSGMPNSSTPPMPKSATAPNFLTQSIGRPLEMTGHRADFLFAIAASAAQKAAAQNSAATIDFRAQALAPADDSAIAACEYLGIVLYVHLLSSAVPVFSISASPALAFATSCRRPRFVVVQCDDTLPNSACLFRRTCFKLLGSFQAGVDHCPILRYGLRSLQLQLLQLTPCQLDALLRASRMVWPGAVKARSVPAVFRWFAPEPHRRHSLPRRNHVRPAKANHPSIKSEFAVEIAFPSLAD